MKLGMKNILGLRAAVGNSKRKISNILNKEFGQRYKAGKKDFFPRQARRSW
jgi:hypothetical protein